MQAGREGNVSFADLGYVHAGLDDFWQDCGSGVNGSFHDKDGAPLVNKARFPDLQGMVAYGARRGLQVGWYLNNCDCSERATLKDAAFIDLTMRQTVKAMVAMNFTGASDTQIAIPRHFFLKYLFPKIRC